VCYLGSIFLISALLGKSNGIKFYELNLCIFVLFLSWLGNSSRNNVKRLELLLMLSSAFYLSLSNHTALFCNSSRLKLLIAQDHKTIQILGNNFPILTTLQINITYNHVLATSCDANH
jgi:hypothetical protein